MYETQLSHVQRDIHKALETGERLLPLLNGSLPNSKLLGELLKGKAKHLVMGVDVGAGRDRDADGDESMSRLYNRRELAANDFILALN